MKRAAYDKPSNEWDVPTYVIEFDGNDVPCMLVFRCVVAASSTNRSSTGTETEAAAYSEAEALPDTVQNQNRSTVSNWHSDRNGRAIKGQKQIQTLKFTDRVWQSGVLTCLRH